MTLIKSISGIRGTIGGKTGENLTPADIIKFTTGFALHLKNKNPNKRLKIVLGRDARISGDMVYHLITGTLLGIGVDVIDIGLATTPTTEIAVINEQANGGIIITASHNPKQWNALKLLNCNGEFVSEADGKEIMELAENQSIAYADVDNLGNLLKEKNYMAYHIEQILQLDLVDKNAIQAANFTIAVDAINSVGGLAVPMLLKELGVRRIIPIHCEPSGNFAHNPEPLPENLKDISTVVKNHSAHVGFAVDPDVDRLAIVCENGEMFGEEYTLVAVADYVLSNTKGNTVSNLSSSFALRDITQKHGGEYFSSAVGELNVVEQMKKCNAVIGGEGNGGVIYPKSHYGRDALLGIALFLTHLAKSKLSCTQLRSQYPEYHISKNKIQLTPEIDVDRILLEVQKKYENRDTKIITIDGVKLEFAKEWVHLRKSNTEPIIRIYAESSTKEKADELAVKIINEINTISK